VTGLDGLESTRQAAWRAYDAIARAFPDCEHNRQWREQVKAARDKHQAAIRACDRAIQEAAR